MLNHIIFDYALSLGIAFSTLVDRIFNKWSRMIDSHIIEMRQILIASLKTAIRPLVQLPEIVFRCKFVVNTLLLFPYNRLDSLWARETYLIHLQHLPVLLGIREGHFNAQVCFDWVYNWLFSPLGEGVAKEFWPADDVSLILILLFVLVHAIRFLQSCVHIIPIY